MQKKVVEKQFKSSYKISQKLSQSIFYFCLVASHQDGSERTFHPVDVRVFNFTISQEMR